MGLEMMVEGFVDGVEAAGKVEAAIEATGGGDFRFTIDDPQRGHCFRLAAEAAVGFGPYLGPPNQVRWDASSPQITRRTPRRTLGTMAGVFGEDACKMGGFEVLPVGVVGELPEDGVQERTRVGSGTAAGNIRSPTPKGSRKKCGMICFAKGTLFWIADFRLGEERRNEQPLVIGEERGWSVCTLAR